MGFAPLLVGLAIAQTTSFTPVFEAADVRDSLHSSRPVSRGGYYTGGRYELHQATMADLIRIAWQLDDNDRVLGGPAWLDDDRFDVLAKAPDSTPPEAAKTMLRNLLRDRFQLAVHGEKRPIQAYILTRGKRDPQLKLALSQANETGTGQCQNRPFRTDPGAVPTRSVSCHSMTMEAFANELPKLAGDYFGHIPVVDLSGIVGAWDFSLQWTTRAQLQPAGSEGTSLYEAIDRQLGLRLELQTAPLSVIVVDRVNEKPLETTPEMMRKLPQTPTEFEVATVKASAAGATPSEELLPSGQIDLRADTLKDLVIYAWNLAGAGESDMLSGPKWMETTRFDMIAKATSEEHSAAPPVDDSTLRMMTRNLLISRFRMAVHYEDRLMTVYSLTGSRPKLTKAEPSSRTGCKLTPLASGSSRSPLTRNIVCRNVTMAGFSEKLRDLAIDYIDHPVVDSTGLQGGWDFVLSFSPRRSAQVDASPASEISDPDGRLTLFEALDKELGLKLNTRKALKPVLVVDRIQMTPTED